jgi:hypothetical protein
MMRRDRIGLALALLLPLLLGPPLALAQQAALQVQVREAEGGAPVAGATVTVDNEAIGFRRELVTDANGGVVLNGLSTSGAYRASVAPADGRAGLGSAPVSLRSDYTHTITLRLPAATLETVTV